MHFRLFLFMLPFMITSCGYRKWLGHSETQRRLASSSLQQLLREDDSTAEQAAIEKLTSLHYYTMIGHKNLKDFDEVLEFESIPYQNLMATRIQIDEIEESMTAEYAQILKSKEHKKLTLFKSTLVKFAGLSRLHQVSLENLLETLSLSDLIPSKVAELGPKELEEHYKSLQLINDFQIHEKNIDHLSHMIDFKFDSDEKKFAPSINKMGSINGSEFPSKVWSLTFDDGPTPASLKIVAELKRNNLKATFFPLGLKIGQRSLEAKDLLSSGMEIGAHSFSHRDLTKAGNLSLDKEISEAIHKVGEQHKKKVGLYRLPYGAGMNATHIRERIAQNDVIHVFWSVDTLDWMPQSAQKIADRTLKLMKKSSKDSGIILFHDTHTRTLLSLPEVLDYLKKDGRKVCTVGQVVQIMNQGAPIICQ
jgi:peptidoglycan/xylan/chitin deacetylase (PgdA/CDA1 family)